MEEETIYKRIDEKCGYFLFQLDSEGLEEQINGEYPLDVILEELNSKKYTDIIILAHGYNTGKTGETTIQFADGAVKSMVSEMGEGKCPLFICIHWPSMPTRDTKMLAQYAKSMKIAVQEFSKRKDRYIGHVEKFAALNPKGFNTHEIHKYLESAVKQGLAIFAMNPITAWFGAKDLAFETYIKRGNTVGSRSVHVLIAYLMKETDVNVKIHLYGFSLGTHVVGAAAIGIHPGSLFSRKIHSMTFFQGSITTTCFKKGEAYRPIVTHLKPIAGPILVTYSKKDIALRGMKTIQSKQMGFSGADQDTESEVKVIQVDLNVAENAAHVFRPNTIWNIDCQAVIKDHNKFVGSRNVMRAFWNAANMECDENSYEMPSYEDLPARYWSSFSVRVEQNLMGRVKNCNIDGL